MFDNVNSNNNVSFGYCMVQTVAENMEGFTKKQVKRATEARSAYHMAGAPDMKTFQLAVRSGLFKNCPLEERDIVNAEKIYGPSVSAIKGKTKRPTPDAIVDNWIEIPSELIARNEEIDLCIDIAFINNFVALTGRDKQLKARHLHELANRTKSQMYSAIDKMFRDYNYAGFRVKTIFCDQEFKPVFEEVKDELGVDMEYTATGEHEPTAERNVQHIKSLFRTQFHRMPFKAIPKVLTKHIAIRVVATSNYYPQKGGISKYYSPHMILNKEKVDYMKECAVESGSYVQGYGHETHRNQRTRTVDAIYCRPDDKSRNGHILFDLHTGKEITRNKVKVLPMTAQVIKMVEDRARDEGVTELRTYSRRNGEVKSLFIPLRV